MGKRRSRSKSVRSQVTRTRTGILNIPSLPPSFDAQPWFPLCLRVTNVPPTFTIGALRSALASQLQLAVAPEIDVRFRDIRFWARLNSSASTALQPCTMRVFDPLTVATIASPALASTAAVIQRFPDQVNRASIGYRYTPAQSQVAIPMPASRISTIPIAAFVGGGDDAVIYFNLWWRTNSSVAVANSSENIPICVGC
jgi:hypothetical protein